MTTERGGSEDYSADSATPASPDSGTKSKSSKPPSPTSSTFDLPIVEVHWNDAFYDSSVEAELADPHAVSKFGRVERRRDVGFLVRADKHALILAMATSDDAQTVDQADAIPIGMVTKVTFLTRSRSCQIKTLLREMKSQKPAKKTRRRGSKNGSVSQWSSTTPTSTTPCSDGSAAKPTTNSSKS